MLGLAWTECRHVHVGLWIVVIHVIVFTLLCVFFLWRVRIPLLIFLRRFFALVVTRLQGGSVGAIAVSLIVVCFRASPIFLLIHLDHIFTLVMNHVFAYCGACLHFGFRI